MNLVNDEMESIELKSVYDLLGLNFFIPCYQRGYKWTKQQVRDLLEDILDFAHKGSKKEGEFYCLQPVVVKPCDEEMVKQHSLSSELDSNRWYEVIDGQQRLTTIHIILSYLEKKCLGGETLKEAYGREKFVLEYETRRKTRDFLDNVSNNQQSIENIDCKYISDAYKTVEEWFENQERPREVRNDILAILLATRERHPVQVIWYELPGRNIGKEGNRSEAIEAFTRLNIGKIPLTNAELIKALFLQRRNFIGEDVNLRQIEIAKEWDHMEHALRRDEFWAFLNKDKNKSSSRIEFLFDFMYQVEKKPEAEAKYGTDEYTTFRFFNEKITTNPEPQNVLSVWEEVKEYFATFQEWYEDNTWYHYIGYLIWEGSNSINYIYAEYKNSSKSAFVDKLKGMVKRSVDEIVYTEVDGMWCFSNISYDSYINKQPLRALFLLYNIEFILQKNADYYRFPFDRFKEEEWNIEHISPQTENALDSKKTMEEWVKVAKASLQEDEKENFCKKFKERAEIDEHELDERELNDRINWILDKVGESDIDEELKGSIGNLTLLNASINKSIRNNIFPAKRREIVEQDKKGTFIPLCTMNTFLKYHTGGNNLRWGKQDILNSMNHMVEILKDYLTLNTTDNTKNSHE